MIMAVDLVDHQVGRYELAAHLYQQVGAASQNPRIGTGIGKQRDRGIERCGCFISHRTLDFR